MYKRYLVKFIFASLLGLFFVFFSFNIVFASSPDAIAIRVMENKNNYSPLRWYQQKGYSGSPQSLEVDGYEAIRDGRTVYVNAANISGGELYTNIYIISYNQEAEDSTVDIFGRILSKWRFNNNISDEGNCFESRSNETLNKRCRMDSDCDFGYFCDSEKAKVVRDVRRLSQLEEIRIALDSYKEANNRDHYPSLNAGTYLANQTISTWPSWQETLGKELGINLPVDPINKLGECIGGYNDTTCWDENDKKFAGEIIEPGDASGVKTLKLVDNSFGIIYSSVNNGKRYMLCSVMESGFVTSYEEGACTGSAQPRSIMEEIENSDPEFLDINLPLGSCYADEYIGYVHIGDPDGDSLNIEFDSDFGWSDAGFSGPPQIRDTGRSDAKEIYFSKIGVPGDYSFNLYLTDSRGGTTEKTASFKVVTENAPTISNIPEGLRFNEIIGDDFEFTVVGTSDGDKYPLIYTIASSTPPPNGLLGVLTPNQKDFLISGYMLDQTGDYNISIKNKDACEMESNDYNFIISIRNNPPEITTDSLAPAIACNYYEQIIEASDPDGHSVNIRVENLPDGLNFDSDSNKITGIPTSIGAYIIKIIAEDEFLDQTTDTSESRSEKDLTLEVQDNNFTLDPISDVSVYNIPAGVSIYELYNGPVTVFLENNTPTTNQLIYSLQTAPDWLHIDSLAGNIQGTPGDAAVGAYNVIVKAENACEEIQTVSFKINVKSNEWCGDNIVNSNEECDDGNQDNSDECSNLCQEYTNWCFMDNSNFPCLLLPDGCIPVDEEVEWRDTGCYEDVELMGVRNIPVYKTRQEIFTVIPASCGGKVYNGPTVRYTEKTCDIDCVLSGGPTVAGEGLFSLGPTGSYAICSDKCEELGCKYCGRFGRGDYTSYCFCADGINGGDNGSAGICTTNLPIVPKN